MTAPISYASAQNNAASKQETESADLGWVAIDPAPRGLGSVTRHRVVGSTRQVNHVTLLAAQFFAKRMGKPILRADLIAHLRKKGFGASGVSTALGELRGALEDKYGKHNTNQIFDSASSHGRTILTIAPSDLEEAHNIVRSLEDVQKLDVQDGNMLAYTFAAGPANASVHEIVQALKDKFPGIILAGDLILFQAYDPDFAFTPEPKPVVPVKTSPSVFASVPAKPRRIIRRSGDDEVDGEDETDDLEPIDQILRRVRLAKPDTDEEGPVDSDSRDVDEDEAGDPERESEQDEESAEHTPKEAKKSEDTAEADALAAREEEEHAEEERRLAQERAREQTRVTQDRATFTVLAALFDAGRAATEARHAAEKDAKAEAAKQALDARNARRCTIAERGMQRYFAERANARKAAEAPTPPVTKEAPTLTKRQIISGKLPTNVDMGHFSANFNENAGTLTSGRKSKPIGETLMRQLLMIYYGNGVTADDMSVLHGGKTPRSSAYRGIANLREAMNKIGLNGKNIITQDEASRYHFVKKNAGAKPGMK